MTNKNDFPTDEILVMALTDAVESAYIGYWTESVDISRGSEGGIIYARIKAFGEDGSLGSFDVNIQKMKDAITKIIKGEVEIRSDIRESLSDEDWDYDSESVDCVIQVVCFGEIIYG